MNNEIKIAVLLTTYNRREKTLACLQSLYAQQLNENVTIEVFLTDDASQDGTAEAVRQLYPDVHVLDGTGSLFWAGGMRFTWKRALLSNPHYYLLLNDDTLLFRGAITTLIENIVTTSAPGICIGSTVDPETGKTSYGGRLLTSKNKWASRLVDAPDQLVQCDLAHCNIMMVPAEVVGTIGILSDGYTHGLADYDYTLKANKAGFKVFIAPGFLGTCKDDHGNNWKSYNVPLKQRIAYLMSPKGLAYHEYLMFIKRHFPASYPTAFVKLWLKTFFPFLWDSLKSKTAVQ